MIDDYFVTLALTNSAMYDSEPMAAPRYGLPSWVMLMPESENNVIAFSW
jgi:hypothetical protein